MAPWLQYSDAMCTQVYLGSDRPLPTISRPTVILETEVVATSRGVRAIWVQPLDPSLNPPPGTPHQPHRMGQPDLDVEGLVRQHLDHPYVYYLGSFMDCGCAFNYSTDPSIGRTAFMKAVRQLRSYLRRVTRDGPVELLVYWSGSQGAAPTEHLHVSPRFFGGREFFLDGHSLLTVTAGKPPGTS
jgi:hypothetical protein